MLRPVLPLPPAVSRCGLDTMFQLDMMSRKKSERSEPMKKRAASLLLALILVLSGCGAR